MVRPPRMGISGQIYGQAWRSCRVPKTDTARYWKVSSRGAAALFRRTDTDRQDLVANKDAG